MTTTIHQPWVDYKTDGITKRYTIGFPYLSRSHVVVTRNGGAPALFKFIDDQTVEVFTIYGEPLPADEPLKVFRQTPDLDAFAEFKDAALLTAEDLNRARLQVLYLVQERSGGLAGSVAGAISVIVNEIETISGALDDIGYTQGQLTHGLETLNELQEAVKTIDLIEDGQKALQEYIDQTIAELGQTTGSLAQRVDAVVAEQNNLRAAVSSQFATLAGNDMAFASRVDQVQAAVDAIDLSGLDDSDGRRDEDIIAASVITSTIAEAKSHSSQARQLLTLKAQYLGAEAMIQEERNVRASEDEALSQQIETVQARFGPVEALIQEERTTRASDDEALAQQIETVQAKFGPMEALIQEERTTRVSEDEALARQITQLQTQVGDDLAQVIQEMETSIEAVSQTVGGVTTDVVNLKSQLTLKTVVQRADGKQVMAGIGLAATSSTDYSGSEIIMQADRLVFADPGDVNGPLKPIFTAGNVDGSPTFVIPSNVMGDRMYPGRLLVDGSIEARSIAANSITADKLVAGEITTDKLAVGLGANLLNASEFTERTVGVVSPRGWYVERVGGVQAAWVQTYYDLAGQTLLGGHTFAIGQSATTGDTAITTSYVQFYSDLIPVTPGTRYEFSVYVGVPRCAADVGLYWYDSANANIASPATSTPPEDAFAPIGSALGGAALTGYRRIGGIVTSPANAAGLRMVVRKGQHAMQSPDSYLFITRPFVAETSPSATRLSPYTPSGLRTLITPGGISTPSLSALSATLGFLMSGTQGGLRTEMDGPQIRVYDHNNVLRVRMGIW